VSVLPPAARLNVRRLLHDLFAPARAASSSRPWCAEWRETSSSTRSATSSSNCFRTSASCSTIRSRPLVEYLYSSVVNHFKGEIAELLAGRVIHRFAKRLGFPVSYLTSNRKFSRLC
jgi:hypothetical protein